MIWSVCTHLKCAYNTVSLYPLSSHRPIVSSSCRATCVNEPTSACRSLVSTLRPLLETLQHAGTNPQYGLYSVNMHPCVLSLSRNRGETGMRLIWILRHIKINQCTEKEHTGLYRSPRDFPVVNAPGLSLSCLSPSRPRSSRDVTHCLDLDYLPTFS